MNRKSTELPGFLVIGAMKAGTTSLHHYLGEHPEVSMPRKRKELNFFNRDENWNRGLEWYQTQFRPNELLKGECCPNYTMYSDVPNDLTGKVQVSNVPERIHDSLPDVKLIYILRDPIERMLSHIHHLWSDGREERDMQAILNDSYDRWNYRRYSCYFFQLRHYLRYFDMKDIHVTTLESLKSEPHKTLKEIYGFLGIDADFADKVSLNIHNASSKKRVSGLFGSLLGRFGKRLPHHFARSLQLFMGTELPKPVLSEEETAGLVSLFKDDVGNLKQLTGLNFQNWTHVY